MAVVIGVLLALCFFTPGVLIGSSAGLRPRSISDQQERTVVIPLQADIERTRATGGWSVAQMAIRSGPVAVGERSGEDRSKILVALLVLGVQALIVGWIWWTVSQVGGP